MVVHPHVGLVIAALTQSVIKRLVIICYLYKLDAKVPPNL